MSEVSRRTFTAAAALLTGHASNVTGADWAIATASAGDGIAHHVTVHNDSSTNHSAKTIALAGFDANGRAVAETIAAPAGSATVTSTKAFAVLTSATPSATIGADTFDIGWAATGHTPWVDINHNNNLPYAVSVGVYLVSGSLNFDGQHTLDSIPDEDSVAFNDSGLTNKSASTDSGHTTPVAAVRVDVNSHTAAVFTHVVMQAGH